VLHSNAFEQRPERVREEPRGALEDEYHQLRCSPGPNDFFSQRNGESFCPRVHHLVSSPWSLTSGGISPQSSKPFWSSFPVEKAKGDQWAIDHSTREVYSTRESGACRLPAISWDWSACRENVVSPLTGTFVEQFVPAWGHKLERGAQGWSGRELIPSQNEQMFYFWHYLGLNSGLCTCGEGTLPHQLVLQQCLLWLFWR
jgi:hypothetical protein